MKTNMTTTDTLLTLTAALLDMFYGSRAAWYDDELPLEMNIALNDPAYVDHVERNQLYEEATR